MIEKKKEIKYGHVTHRDRNTQKAPEAAISFSLSLSFSPFKTAPKLVNRTLKMTKRFKQTRNRGFHGFPSYIDLYKNVISCWNLTYLSNLQIQPGTGLLTVRNL